MYNHEPVGSLGEKVLPIHPTDTVTSCRKEFITNSIRKRELNSNVLNRAFLLKMGILGDSRQVVVAAITGSDP